MDKNLLNILDELRSIAQLGLNYSKDNYDRERYNRLLDIASKEYCKISGIDDSLVKNLFQKELGYITPKLGVNGIIVSDNKILLEKRSDDKKWGIPGGWVEVGESPQESLKREFLEETGLKIAIEDTIDIFTRKPGDFGTPHSSCHILYRCHIEGGKLLKSFESLEVGFYNVKDIDDWHNDHYKMILKALN